MDFDPNDKIFSLTEPTFDIVPSDYCGICNKHMDKNSIRNNCSFCG